MELGNVLYTKMKEFKCKPGKTAGMRVPAGLPRSKFASASAGIAKYSNVVLVLDELFAKHVAVLEASNAVYCEIEEDGILYRGNFDGLMESWEKDAPSRIGQLIPVIMYTLKSSTCERTSSGSEGPYYEFACAFSKCVKEYNASKDISFEALALLCDSFYYSFAVNNKTIEVRSDDFSIDTVKKAMSSGLYTEMPIMKDLKLKDLSIKVRNTRKKVVEEAPVVEDSYEKCLNGDFKISYDWKEDVKDTIPALETLNNYVPEASFYSSLRKIKNRMERCITKMDAGNKGISAIGNDYVNIMIVGKPGTGKTTMGYALGAALGMPTYTVSVSKHTEEDTFEGMNKVIDGKLQFVGTDFLNAYINGGIILLEEMNLADPAVMMGALGQAIEPPFILKQDGYKKVRRHPLCVIIGTMNIGTFGAKGVNQAFSSRFKQTYVLDDPKKETFISILEKQGYKKRQCTYVYTAYEKTVNYLKGPNVNREDVLLNLSIRSCLGALQNYDDGDTMKEAIRNSIIGKIYELDPELSGDVERDVIETLPDMR